jgi:DNA-3-methyladenine glycosylase II
MNFQHSFAIRPEPPYNFELTVRKPAGWPLFTREEVWEEKTLWSALQIDCDLVGVKLRSNGTTEKPLINADVFLRSEPGKSRLAKIRATLTSKLGADADLSEFYSLAKKDEILRDTVKDLYGMHNTGFATLFAAATLAISLQMAPIAWSNRMQECIIKKYGETADFDGKSLRAWPTATVIAGASAEELSRQCKWGYRAKFLVKTAQAVEAGFPSLEELRQLPPDEAKRKIMDLPGIGDYSADLMNPHGGFSIDVWSADIFGKLFFGKDAATGRNAIDKIKEEGIKRWGKWARLAFVYVVHDIPRLSKRAGMQLRLS